MRTLWCIIVLVIAAAPSWAQRDLRITGLVVDAGTSAPLPFASVRALETRTSTMSDRKGSFRLLLRADALDGRDSLTLVFSLVGHDADTVRVAARDTTLRILLRERAFVGAMVTVSAEDPAVPIMRRVLARKLRQRDSLRTYSYMLYTKFIATTDTATAMRSSGRGDTTVFSILESFSKGYYQRPGTYFNEIIQRRQTANIPPQANFVSFGTNLNAYDDVVTILNEEIESPFHPDAIDHYDFVLLTDGERDTVVIDVRPKGARRRAFNGTLYVDQRRAIPLEVRLTPNAAVNLPFDATLSYRQSFMLVDEMVVPEALSIMSSLKADILFIISPRLDIDIETFCYDYDINPELDPTIFEQRRVEIAEQASTFDTLYWQENQKLPLRKEEEQAYADIQNMIDNPDSLQSTFLDRYLGPVTRTIARLGRRPFSGFEDVVRYNRIHGLYLGLGLRFRPDTVVELEAGLGYGVADDRGYYWLRSTWFLGARQNWSVDGAIVSVLQRRDDPFVVRTGLITATSLLFGNDYGDYYYRNGMEVGVGYAWGQLRFIRNDLWARPSGIRLFFRSEDQRSATTRDVWSLIQSGRNDRANPAIMDGTMRSFGATISLNYSPIRLIARTGTSLSFETSRPWLVPSSFDFSRLQWLGVARFRTLPLWTMDIVATAGWTWGHTPPQRFSSLESSVSGLVVGSVFRGMNVKEFYGDRYATISLSHNFGEVIPGLLRIPDIASFGIEFIAFGGVGYTTFSDAARSLTQTALPSTADAPETMYYEVGLGINRVLLFFRLDVNARLSQRTVPEFRITLSGATF